MNYSGVVASASSFDYQGKKLWSFQLNGMRNYFRLGQTAPKFDKGSYIEFVGEPDAKGNVKVDANTIVVKQGDAAPTNAKQGFRQAVRTVASGGMSKDDYWERKELRDIETQKRIEVQSCRNSALEMISHLIKIEALKIPVKVPERVKFLEELLEHYTVEFQKRNAGPAPAASKEEGSGSSSSEDFPSDLPEKVFA